MPRRLRDTIAWTLFIFVIAGLLWLAKLSPSYRECDADYKQHPAYSESTNSHKERIRRFVLCEGAFFDANHDAITAIATLAIAIFTLTLWRATKRQVGLSEQNVAVAREQTKISKRLASIAASQFRAEHRPRLRIRYVDYEPNTDDGEGNLIGARVHFTNIGATNARIIMIWARIFRASAATMRDLTTYPGGMIRMDSSLDAGASDSKVIPSEFRDIGETRRVAVLARQSAPAEGLFLIGRIQYRDEAGIARDTGLCWHLDIVRQQWLRTTDQPELNYED